MSRQRGCSTMHLCQIRSTISSPSASFRLWTRISSTALTSTHSGLSSRRWHDERRTTRASGHSSHPTRSCAWRSRWPVPYRPHSSCRARRQGAASHHGHFATHQAEPLCRVLLADPLPHRVEGLLLREVSPPQLRGLGDQVVGGERLLDRHAIHVVVAERDAIPQSPPHLPIEQVDRDARGGVVVPVARVSALWFVLAEVHIERLPRSRVLVVPVETPARYRADVFGGEVGELMKRLGERGAGAAIRDDGEPPGRCLR